MGLMGHRDFGVHFIDLRCELVPGDLTAKQHYECEMTKRQWKTIVFLLVSISWTAMIYQ